MPIARLICRSLKYDPGSAQGVQGIEAVLAKTEPSDQRSEISSFAFADIEILLVDELSANRDIKTSISDSTI
jgi:hypothetical protein